MKNYIKWNFDNSYSKLPDSFKEIIKPVSVLNPELIFVPCLAFDKKGNRLGYGGGYYDRTFAYLNKINHRFISVAYAYEEQKLDYIPIDKFDFKVDYVITEKNLYSFQ